MDLGIMRMLQWERELEMRSQRNGFHGEPPLPLPAEETPEVAQKGAEKAPALVRQETSCECA
jgi:hypothetical protein